MITRKLSNGFEVVDLSEEINEVDNQYGFIKSRNYFSTRNTAQTSIVFDMNQKETTLLPMVSRSSREKSYGKDSQVSTFALALSYFKHGDEITPEDIQDFRQPGTELAETLNNVRAEKLTDMRLAADQTDEYLQLQALKGICKSPDGQVIANMFEKFGITPNTVDLDLGNAASDLNSKLRALKSAIARDAKTGGAIGGIEVMLSPEMFDKLIKHPDVIESYINYNASINPTRDDLSSYQAWGISDAFVHKGIRFVTYDALFTLPDGTSERAFEAAEGLAIPFGVRDMFRGYYGPANKLSLANQPGRNMFVFEYADMKDECRELELEMAPLYFATRPRVLWNLTSST